MQSLLIRNLPNFGRIEPEIESLEACISGRYLQGGLRVKEPTTGTVILPTQHI